MAESAANKNLCVSVLMLVDWDATAGCLERNRAKRSFTLLITSVFPTLTFKLGSRNYNVCVRILSDPNLCVKSKGKKTI